MDRWWSDKRKKGRWWKEFAEKRRGAVGGTEMGKEREKGKREGRRRRMEVVAGGVARR